jgi:TM2 domain-containing membrane protein YozV
VATHNNLVGYLLWVLGFAGVHRFYYGKRTSGAVYLLTLGLCGIGWLVDLFLIPRMTRQVSRRYQAGRYSYSKAWLLLAFGGVLGLHRFYLRHWAAGFAYLLTGGFVGIGVLYDLLTLNDTLSTANEAWISDTPQLRGRHVG